MWYETPIMTSALSLRTLVLNADYQPIGTWPLSLIPATEAVTAVMRERASVVAEWPDAFLRSPSVTIAVPKVIALRQYAPIHASPKFCRRSILLRDKFRCQYCGERFQSEDLTFDHVIPRARGGKTEWTNILACCVPCNARKRDTLPSYSSQRGKGLRPLKEPRQPTTAELLRAGLEFLDPDVRGTWGDWLYWDGALQP
jgi:5-methylcytosine-specific restriction endonuclease McrA